MKLYLDNCCFNRPFDDQKSIKIKLEAEAKLFVQERVKQKEFEIVWSYILDFENSANPFDDRKEAIKYWKDRAIDYVKENKEVIAVANEIGKFKVKSKDALHIACAIYAKCTHFLTTDDVLIKKLKSFKKIKVQNPLEFISSEIKYGNK